MQYPQTNFPQRYITYKKIEAPLLDTPHPCTRCGNLLEAKWGLEDSLNKVTIVHGACRATSVFAQDAHYMQLQGKKQLGLIHLNTFPNSPF